MERGRERGRELLCVGCNEPIKRIKDNVIQKIDHYK